MMKNKGTRNQEKNTRTLQERIRSWFGGHADDVEVVLKERLEQKERELQFLQSEVIRLDSQNTSLRLRQRAVRPALAVTLRKSDSELIKQEPSCMVQKTEDGSAWEVVTERCSLGGCDMGVYTFPDERTARLYAALLDAIGYRPTHSAACFACYAKYMEDYKEI